MAAALLLGDSIRMGYQPFVAQALSEWNVLGPAENCRSSRDLAAALEGHLDTFVVGPTIVHVNAGLHDLRREADAGWGHVVPLADYRRHVRTILTKLVGHPLVGAGRVLVATTTPVDSLRYHATSSSRRNREDVVAYNDVLVAAAHQCGVAVNDLHGFVVAEPVDVLAADGVHFTAAGYRRLGERVAAVIAAHARRGQTSNSNQTG